MKIVYISGSPRKKDSNTDYLLNLVRSVTGGEFIKLIHNRIAPCNACRGCLKHSSCKIDDDFTNLLTPVLLEADAVIAGSPVHFNNVSSQLKAFIDRTWSLRGKIRNKIGGAVVVGKRYGAESAITAIHAFFLKHEMIPANRGVCGMAFNPGEIKTDAEAMASATKLGERILELEKLTHRGAENYVSKKRRRISCLKRSFIRRPSRDIIRKCSNA
ncbi:MAG TPA: flavodoxin family protein [Syntrophales bacterium]|nr:flavodoxin family protein [Syntrophales bacterium]